MNKTVSIIIANYNNGKYIEQCIQSCLEQTYKDIEIIVIDDCSKDDSVARVKKMQEYDTRIKLIQNPQNLKVIETRHVGINTAKGDWLCTLDSDDYFISNRKIEAEITLIAKKGWSESIIAYSNIVMVDLENKRLKTLYRPWNVGQGFILEQIVSRICVVPRDFIFSKKMYYAIGGFDLSLKHYEDWDIKIKLAKKCRFYYSYEEGTAYRQHDFGISSLPKDFQLNWQNIVMEKNSINAKLIKPSLVLKNNYHFKNIFSTIKNRFF